MKYLLQADWERLVKNSERYEALATICLNFPGLGFFTRERLEQLTDAELERQADESRRANGDTRCAICDKPLRLHPKGGPIGCGDEQFLNRLCDGSLVKL